jgi:TRAP transporter TAXI family solute receptor
VAAQDVAFIGIGTGAVSGVYYPAGGAICRVVNRGRIDHGLRCAAEVTAGSIENIRGVQDGTLDFAIVQSDIAFTAANGNGDVVAGTGLPELRAVFALHAEPFTLVARRDAGIADFTDLKNKRVNVGPPGSGQRATLETLMEALGWSLRDFGRTTELPANEQAGAFCDGRFDAMIYAVGHPAASIREVTSACDGVLVPVTGPEIDALVENAPYFRMATIPGGLYRGNDADVETFGVGALLVTTEATPEDVVFLLTRSVFDEIDQLRDRHPAFTTLDPRSMAREGLAGLPLHPGAERYFREAGLIE